MKSQFQQIDRILRGEATRPSDIRDGRLSIPLGLIGISVVMLGGIAGLCTGVYALVPSRSGRNNGPSSVANL